MENEIIEEVEEIVKGKSFFKKILIIFTGKFSPFRIIIYKLIIKGIIFNISREFLKFIHVLSSIDTLKELKDHTKRAIIYSVLITTILISILEYNFEFIHGTIDAIRSFFTSINKFF